MREQRSWVLSRGLALSLIIGCSTSTPEKKQDSSGQNGRGPVYVIGPTDPGLAPRWGARVFREEPFIVSNDLYNGDLTVFVNTSIAYPVGDIRAEVYVTYSSQGHVQTALNSIDGWRLGLADIKAVSSGSTVTASIPGLKDQVFSWNGTSWDSPAGNFDQLSGALAGPYTWFRKDDQLSYVFDSCAGGVCPIQSISSRTGRQLIFNYLGGQLQSISDSISPSRQILFNWTASGRPNWVQDPLGRQVSFGYDPSGRMNSITLPGTTPSLTIAYENIATLPSNVLAAVSQVVEPGGRWLNFVWNPGGLPNPVGPEQLVNATVTDTLVYGDAAQITNSRGQSSQYNFNSLGQLSSVLSDGGTVSYVFDSLFRMTSSTDENGITTTWSNFNAQGNPQTTTQDGLSWTTAYETNGYDVHSVTASTGERSTVMRFSNGNIFQRVEDKVGGATSVTTTYTYYPGNVQLRDVVDPLGPQFTYAYDTYENVLSITRDGSLILQSASNLLGWPQTVTEYVPGSMTTRVSTYGYDSASGRPTTINSPSGSLVHQYTPDGKWTGYSYTRAGSMTPTLSVSKQYYDALSPFNGLERSTSVNGNFVCGTSYQAGCGST